MLSKAWYVIEYRILRFCFGIDLTYSIRKVWHDCNKLYYPTHRRLEAVDDDPAHEGRLKAARKPPKAKGRATICEIFESERKALLEPKGKLNVISHVPVAHT